MPAGNPLGQAAGFARGRRGYYRPFGGGPAALTLPMTNLRGGWEARSGVGLVDGDVDTVADVSGNGRTMTAIAGRPTMTTVDGFAAIRFDNTQYLRNTGFSAADATTKTVYFVGRLDNISPPQYRAIFGGGSNWAGGNFDGYMPYPHTGAVTTKTLPLGTLFQFSMEITTGTVVNVRDAAGLESTLKTAGTWQQTSNLQLGATNGAFYGMQGEMIASYYYDGPFDSGVPAFITQEWGAE